MPPSISQTLERGSVTALPIAGKKASYGQRQSAAQSHADAGCCSKRWPDSLLTGVSSQEHTRPKFLTTSGSLPRLVERSMPITDVRLICKVCGAEFVFTASEQEFFGTKGYTNVPKSCRRCRANLKGGRPRLDVTVTCSDCGQTTTVPFKPVKGKPVFCRDCFVKQRKAG